MRDRVSEFFSEKTPKRALALLVFLLLILLFRKLFVLLAFFVAFERMLFWSAGLMARRFKMGRAAALGLVLTATAIVLGLTAWLSAGAVEISPNQSPVIRDRRHGPAPTRAAGAAQPRPRCAGSSAPRPA